MSTIINGSSPSITFSDGTTQSSAVQNITGGVIQVASGGTGRSTAPAYFSAYLSADTGNIISANTWTKCPINTTTIDNSSGFVSGSNRFTVPTGYAGYYLVTGTVRMRNNTGSVGNSPNQALGAIVKNGTRVQYSEIDSSVSNNFWTTTQNMQTVIQLAVGDYIEVWGYCSAGPCLFRNESSALTCLQLYGA